MKDRTRNWILLGIALVLLAGSVWAFYPPDTKISKGLDIQGGLSVILTAQGTKSNPVTTDAMDRAQAIVQNRVNKLGASEATVQKQGRDSILVQIPGIKNADEALKTLGQTGQLEFVDVSSIEDTATAQAAATQGSTLKKGTYTPFMTGSSIKKATVQQNSKTNSYEVNVTLDPEGTKKFAEETTKLAPTNGQISIVLDGVVQSAPAVQSAITDGNVSITGSFTLDQAKNLQLVLENGALPVTLKFSESRIVGPTLGAESLKMGVTAALIGLAIVAVYVLIFYRGMGILTVLSMGALACIYLGVLALLSRFGLFALSLPGIAGIVLTIGIAADSSILILERFREEIGMGRSVRAASISGVKHAIQTSIDADLVTMVSGLALFLIAIGPVKGFGLTLVIGIVCDIIVMVFFKAPIVRLLAPHILADHRKFWGLPAEIHQDKNAQRKSRKSSTPVVSATVSVDAAASDREEASSQNSEAKTGAASKKGASPKKSGTQKKSTAAKKGSKKSGKKSKGGGHDA